MYMPIPGPAAIYGSIIPLLILDVIAVAARFYARRQRRQPLKIDDWLTVPALVLIIGLASTFFYGIGAKALGYAAPPMPDMAEGPELSARSEITASDWSIVTARRLEYAFLVIFAPTNGLVKLSVLFLYRRIFVIDKNWKNARNLFFMVMITLIGLWSLAYTFTFMFMCKGKFEVLFTDLLAAMSQCVNTFLVGYSCSISDFIGDVLIVLIPIPLVLRLQLPGSSKIAVLFVFLLGILASAASLIRMLWMIWAFNVGMDPTLDEGLLLTSELYWCMMEITLGLLAACIPTLRGLFRSQSADSIVKGIRSLFSTGQGSTSSTELVSSKRSKSLGRDDADAYVTVNVNAKALSQDKPYSSNV